MSFIRKLRTTLKVQKTGNRRRKITPLNTITIEDMYIPASLMKYDDVAEYSIQAVFGGRVYGRNGTELERQKEIMFEDIATEIYGGIRQHLLALERAIYNDDRQEIDSELRLIYKEMEI